MGDMASWWGNESGETGPEINILWGPKARRRLGIHTGNPIDKYPGVAMLYGKDFRDLFWF